ncbi:MAG: hypothetical protein ACRDI2_12470, partial [Chloroflexota bacterium]
MPTLATASADQPEHADASPAPDLTSSRGHAPGGPPASPADQAISPSTPPAPPREGDTSPDASSLERMARLRHLVRHDGLDTEAAAGQVGVD